MKLRPLHDPLYPTPTPKTQPANTPTFQLVSTHPFNVSSTPDIIPDRP
jgi:hypothetical protein